MELEGKLILITGASRGLGARVAQALGPERPILVLTARDAAGLEGVAASARAAGAKVHVVAADVADAAGRARLVAAVEALGPLEVLINNAGIEIAVAFADQTPEDIERQLGINLLAPLLLTRAFLPGMLTRRRGAVVMVSSMSGKTPTPYNSVYAATKHALNGLVSSLRLELEGSGVTAGVVCPSFVAEAGMWADSGISAPALMREVRPDAVVAAVRAVIDGAGEVLVTPGPVRPLLALAQMFPGLTGPVLRRMGVMDALAARARAVAAKRS